MNEFTTENGTKLFWEIRYDIGGYNHFNGRNIARGYYLSIKRNRNEFMAFSGLENPTGAVRMLVVEVGRKSAKQEQKANELITDEYLQSIANRYGL